MGLLGWNERRRTLDLILRGGINFFFPPSPKCLDQLQNPPNLLSKGTDAPSLGGKLPEQEADHPSPSAAVLVHGVIPPFPKCLRGMVLAYALGKTKCVSIITITVFFDR